MKNKRIWAVCISCLAIIILGILNCHYALLDPAYGGTHTAYAREIKGFTYVEPRIYDEKWLMAEKQESARTISFLQLPYDSTTEQILNRMKLLGIRPANISDLINFRSNEHFRINPSNQTIVALGSKKEYWVERRNPITGEKEIVKSEPDRTVCFVHIKTTGNTSLYTCLYNQIWDETVLFLVVSEDQLIE